MLKLRVLPFCAKSNAVVSEQTCNFHHGKHHNTYVNNFNNLIKDSEFKDACFYDILLTIMQNKKALVLQRKAHEIKSYSDKVKRLKKRGVKMIAMKQC